MHLFKYSSTPDPTATPGGKLDETNPDEMKLPGTPLDNQQMSYIERALYGFLKKAIFGGYDVLKSPPYAVAFWYIVGLIAGAIVLGAIIPLWYSIPPIIMPLYLTFGIFNGLAFIIGGLAGGLTKKDMAVNYITLSLIVLSVLGAWVCTFNVPMENIVMWMRLAFFIIYIAISSISIFFLILTFHSSLPYRILTLGNSQGRLFFQPIIRIGAWITILLFGYLFLQDSIDALILGGFGLIIIFLLLIKVYTPPILFKEDTFEQKEQKAATINLRQAIGFYNLYLLYQVSQSYNTGGKISNLWIDVFLLAVTSFFIINSLSAKVDKIEDIEEEQKQAIKFRSQSQVFMKIKKQLGEKSLIYIALGLSLGYLMVLVGSFLGFSVPIVQNLAGELTPLNVVFHRIFLWFGLIIIVLVFLIPSYFQELATNRYTPRHAMRMFGDLFRQSVSQGVTNVATLVESGKQKIAEFGGKLMQGFKKWNAGMQKKTSSKKSGPADQDQTNSEEPFDL